MSLTKESMNLLIKQQDLARQIAELSETEKEVRQAFVKSLDLKGKTEGSSTFPMSQGYKLEVKLNINRTIDKAALTGELRDHLGSLGVIVDEFIVNKPELKDGPWKKLDRSKLDDLGREMLRNLVTEKPGLPSVKILAPEVKQ